MNFQNPKKKRFPLFWLIIALLLIAYPVYFIIYGMTYTPDPDAFISMNGEGLALLLAIIFLLPYLAALALTVLVREIILFVRKKTSRRRLITAIVITAVITVGTVIFLSFT